MFNIDNDNNAQISSKDVNQDINRGLALLVLITISVVGSSWMFSLPVYFDIKIAAQIFPIFFSIVLLFLVTKNKYNFLNKIAPVLGFVFVFCSWTYVVYLDSIMSVSADLPNQIKNIVEAQYLGMSYTMYLIGLCFSIFWLGRYFKYNLYLSLASVVIFLIVIFLFTDTKFINLLALALLLGSSSVFSAISLSSIHAASIENVQEDFFDPFQNSEKKQGLPATELSEQRIEPQLDINALPLNEASITHDWELILRELHGELKNITDVDQLFKSMLVFLHGAMEFDAAAVGMLQDKNIRKITDMGDEEYVHARSLNWSNQRVKKLFSLREPIISTQKRLSANTNNIDELIHRLDVPVLSNNKIVGLVTLFRDEPIFDTHDIKLTASIVFHSMIALRQARLQEEIKRLNSDSPGAKLTLYSREQFVSKVKPVFDKLSRPRECSLFIVEIDNLDSVIDKQGRDAGMLLYKESSRLIMSCLSDSDILGRYGNDGFVVLLDETNLMHAKDVAEKIRIKISSNKVNFNDSVLNSTVSIGLTIVSDANEDLASLMRKADMGLFVAKENGCDTIKVSL